MAIAPGTRLGPYDIVALLGAGGMGEVYKATDTRLGRTVAIKVLAPQVVNDPDIRARFEREARAVSSLSHAHICALYDIGRQDQPSGEPIDYLVLEYLEGEMLDARLARGALPVEQAVRCGVETCEALDYAHRHGVTHRDLKPGNVIITTAGVKLLDFGLAKPVPVVGHGSNQSMVATTVTSSITAKGTILGTIHYMAPEQIEGREADARSDVWAFGCVMYELLTGGRAFDATTPASLIAAILERDPAPIRLERGSMPPRLWNIVRTCLAKNPDDRWQSMRDLGRELRWCMSEAPADPVHHIARSRRALLMGFVAVVLAVAGAVGIWEARGVSSSSAAAPPGPPVIVLMDSTHPERIYDDQTRKAGGTNADDLTDLLRDLPVRLVKENTNATWHREYEVIQENPALIVAHRSCFYDATILGEASRQGPFVNLSWDKFETFAALVAQANPRTKVLAYSRGSWADDPARERWVTVMEQRFPPLRGRIDAMQVPLDRATFRNPMTGSEIRRRILAMLPIQGVKS